MANVLEGTEAWTMLGERREGVSYILGGFVWEGGGGGDVGTLWSSEMDHVSVFFEHVYLLDGLDGLDV